MDQVGVAQLLDDLRSIKLPVKSKQFVDSCNTRFGKMDLPIADVVALRKIARRYRKKIDELYQARESARKSIWRKKNGISLKQANEIVKQKATELEAERSDLGI